MRRSCRWFLALFVISIPPAAAQSRAAPASPPTSVRTIHGIRWHGSLESAVAEASRRKQPIVWLRTLGDLTGKT